MGERAGYEPGTFCWAGLATSDPAEAEGFYTRLLGWEAQALSAGPAGTYRLMRRGDRDVAIVYRQTAQARAAHAQPHWTSYISVTDADATATRAGELGGAAVFRHPFDVADAGRVAAIRDPTGAIVSLWQPRATPGAAVVNDVGALCWNELATTDVERARTFFSELLGWRYHTDDAGYTTITNAGHRNGAIRRLGDHERAIHPDWLAYFTVDNIERAARHAERLGGRRLGPTTRTANGRFALIADAQHAPLAIFEGATDP
jgi:predicted enzyme related to lactoylglutathione lyase